MQRRPPIRDAAEVIDQLLASDHLAWRNAYGQALSSGSAENMPQFTDMEFRNLLYGMSEKKDKAQFSKVSWLQHVALFMDADQLQEFTFAVTRSLKEQLPRITVTLEMDAQVADVLKTIIDAADDISFKNAPFERPALTKLKSIVRQAFLRASEDIDMKQLDSNRSISSNANRHLRL